MRNLVILQDLIHEFPINLTPSLTLDINNLKISDICAVTEREELLILFSSGIVISHGIGMEQTRRLAHEPWNLNEIESNISEENQNKWFYIQAVGETGSMICISRSGMICSIQSNRMTDQWNDIPEVEGCVDDGICDAALSPDQSCLLLATNNNTLLLMTNTFDVINEVPIETRKSNSPCVISWTGDSLQFALYSVDAADDVPRIRIYNRDLILLHEGRTAADGAGAIVRNLLPCISYAPNGSMIAVAQQKTPKKQQITIFERSALRHGEFDIQVPWILESVEEKYTFNVISLQFNIETNVLAVGLQALYKDTNQLHSQYVQLYHRNNYHWYLKQQWSGDGIAFGRFDSEFPDRLYLSMSPSQVPISENEMSGFRVRLIDYVWDVCTAESEDCTAAVVDGRKVLMTPLGKALVPPPMSLYSLDLPSPSRDTSFWIDASGTKENNWGFACLCDGDLIRLWTQVVGEKPSRGQPNLQFQDINLAQIAKESHLEWNCFVRNIKGVIINTESKSEVAIVCVASVPISTALEQVDVADKVIVLRQEELRGELVWRMEDYPILSGGSILRLISWANDFNCIGIGLSSASAPFEVVKMAFDEEIQFTTEFTFSEPCARKLSVVKSDLNDSQGKYLCMGLSSTPHSSRLYCCDNLLSSSHVSSFVVNPSLGVLLYVTATSKPLLHFASMTSLSHIVDDIESNLLAGEAASQPLFTFSAPRPVERGARLVASPLNSALTVLQIPRGNLEGCEPRPLVLMKSRMLLDQKKYLECLLLLRRQRVDLNLLIDHNPLNFLEQVPQLVPLMLKTNPDLLSLLISALENGNICAQKYALPEMYHGQHPVQQSVPVPENSFNWENKVTIVCENIRNTLYQLLTTSTEIKTDELLPPLLCSYSKQRPPLLPQALYLIKRYSLDLPLLPRQTVSDYLSTRQHISQALSASKTQKCLKYIAFLCNYQELFDAALGECDFDMARAIARQGGQMDPKIYLPLLQSLESLHSPMVEEGNSKDISTSVNLDVIDTSIGVCPNQTSSTYCFMRFKVYLHLRKYESALDWGLTCLESVALKRAHSNSANDEIELSLLVKDILSIVSENNLFVRCFPKLRTLRLQIISTLTEIANNAPAPTIGGLTLKIKKKTPTISDNHISLSPVVSLLSKLFYAYGQLCYSKGEYSEAIAAYLSSVEPMSSRGAVEAAIQKGDWHLALGLGGKYYDPNESVEEEGEENPFFQTQQQSRSLNPQDIARELLDSFRSTIEQGIGGESAASEYYLVFQHNSKLVGDANSGGDRALEASQLCLEYFDDVEGAVNILLLAKRWRYAAQLASRKRRLDLLREEVGSTLKIEAQQVIKVLRERKEKHVELVQKLTALWVDGPGRLKAVSEVDPGLLKSLQGKATQDDSEETRSDFGGGTSVYSNISAISAVSTSSVSSTLSMLSNLSNLEMPSGKGSSESRSEKSFAIDGIEHNLLSRGKTDRTEFTQYDNAKAKKRKQKMRSKGDGGGRDIFGLKQEGVMTRLLYNLGDISAVSVTVAEICEVLLFVGGNPNQALACELQIAMDSYIEAISSTVSPEAPLYPLEWLQKRNMEEVRWFQNTPENMNPDGANAQKVWWRQAVTGINLWRASKLNTLTTSS